MIKKLLVLFIITPLLLPAQQLDESFLKTLPENLKDDFLEQSKTSEDKDKNYPNPETRIRNLESALESAELTLKTIRNDLENNQEDHKLELKRIGENFFQTFQSTFLPINEPNNDSSYILDTGDKISLQLLGQKNNLKDLIIKRNGAISIPDVGEVKIAGLTLDDASRLVKKYVSEAFIGVEAFISLAELRDINALIIGNANKPGMYTLSGGSTPLSLLHAAGGISEVGSYRSISHKRNNQIIQNIDLYELLLKGNVNYMHQLRSGDVLIVNPKLNEVRVSGAFANPGIYEVFPGDNLENILALAFPQKNFKSQNLKIERYIEGKINVLEFSNDNLLNFELQDSDNISLLGVSPKFAQTKKVTITGEVNVPGIYSVSDETTVADLIRKANGYTNRAYGEGGILLRQSARELEEAFREKSYYELINYYLASPSLGQNNSTNSASDNIIGFLSLLKDFNPIGRVVTEFSLPLLDSNPSLNRILQHGDRIHIPEFTRDVFVFGEVMNPGPVSYKELADHNDYIEMAGSITRIGDSKRIIIISPSGEINSLNKFGKIFSDKTYILPGSTIYVPMQIGKLDGINLSATVAPIISSFALSIASLNAIK